MGLLTFFFGVWSREYGERDRERGLRGEERLGGERLSGE